jgi:hypothetical protein
MRATPGGRTCPEPLNRHEQAQRVHRQGRHRSQGDLQRRSRRHRDKLGLYKAMAGAGQITPAELASRTLPTNARTWWPPRATGGYVTYDPATQRLSPLSKRSLANPMDRCFSRAMQLAVATLRKPALSSASRPGRPRIARARPELFQGTERFFDPTTRQSGEQLDSGARRRRTQAEGQREGRRRGLRLRRVDDPDGDRISSHSSSASITTGVNQIRAAGSRRRRCRGSGDVKVTAARISTTPNTTSSRSSTASTTWAIRSAPRHTCSVR